MPGRKQVKCPRNPATGAIESGETIDGTGEQNRGIGIEEMEYDENR